MPQLDRLHRFAAWQVRTHLERAGFDVGSPIIRGPALVQHEIASSPEVASGQGFEPVNGTRGRGLRGLLSELSRFRRRA